MKRVKTLENEVVRLANEKVKLTERYQKRLVKLEVALKVSEDALNLLKAGVPVV